MAFLARLDHLENCLKPLRIDLTKGNGQRSCGFWLAGERKPRGVLLNLLTERAVLLGEVPRIQPEHFPQRPARLLVSAPGVCDLEVVPFLARNGYTAVFEALLYRGEVVGLADFGA